MDFVPAPFWRRLVARVIDLVVCIPLTFVAIIPVLIIMIPVFLLASDNTASSLGAFLCYFVAYGLVEYYLLRRRSGQTLGKGLMGLRVLNADDVPDPSPAGYPGAIDEETGPAAPVRSMVAARAALVRMLVLMGPLFLALAGYYLTADANGNSNNPVATGLLWLWVLVLVACAITAIVDKRGHRGVHDRLAGTRVVRAQKRGIDLGADLRMLVPGRVSLEKRTPPVTLTKPSGTVPLTKKVPSAKAE